MGLTAPVPDEAPVPDFLATTRAGYDTIAADYAEHFRAEWANLPLERGMYAAFAELVRAAGSGPVADVGCGPGQLTAHLHTLGLDVLGIDLSAGMVAVARRDHPDLRFHLGSMTALPIADGVLGGLVANYSIIHIPPEVLPTVFAEFRRVLAPGGHLLVAFQVGEDILHLSSAFGRDIALDFRRLVPERVVELLEQAGLSVQARLRREPRPHERSPQAMLLARRSSGR
ncbi:class I SAM-dependent DNA methyltransferase [Micromonospora sagamiensis]|uniref:Methyltransferase family protein n=1 Tax=Micromonospora sagamiensis TaxID=47875 RepID=A0A562WAD7_9ACTN|nr:class I SAM-dependent methyltransferase [Micromonospora sagamiensis]TWJ27230.1 methyltransferase family protein [Micromonospora sagamiensis]BCL13875.1 methyltransferase [Micromonospora sagamiensis]